MGVEALAERLVRTLSAGQRRRVALAALALCVVPLWLLDEPATNLDADGQRLVGGLIAEQLARGGLAVAAVHHSLALPAGQRAAAGARGMNSTPAVIDPFARGRA